MNELMENKSELKTKESMRRAIDKYNSKFAEVKIRVKPDIKDKIKARAEENGISVQAYIIDLIDNDSVDNQKNNLSKQTEVLNSNIIVFNNAEFGNVRTMEINGEPWFVGKDVAVALGYKNTRKALSDHVDDEDKDGVTIRDSIGREQTSTIINESGLYSLILSSKLDTAKKFKHWVISEVLPTIRKTGTYSMAESNPDSYMIENPADRARRWAEEYEEKLALECKIAEQQPKVDYHDAVLNKSGLMTTTAIAKDLGFKSAKQLNDLLKRDRVIYKKSDTYYLYADYEYLITEGYCDYKSYKTENSSLSLQWTEKGRKWLRDRYAN